MVKRYEILARDIADAILQGAIQPGERLPSVRLTCTSRNLSPATVFQAYYRLEAQGLVEARERSGYFVMPHARNTYRDTGNAMDADLGTTPGTEDLLCEVMNAAARCDIVPFGSSAPGPSLYPLAQIAHLLAETVTRMAPNPSVEDLAPGHPPLQRQLALRYLIDGIHVAPDQIVITNGGLDAMNLCLRTVANPGDAVLIDTPCFYAAAQSIVRQGMRPVPIPADPVSGMNLAALERALVREKPSACWTMTTFQHPLGTLMPVEKKRQLVELLTRHRVPLIEDDVYAELYFGSQRPLPAKAFDTEGIVMHCSSFSKSLAPGYRIGWTAAGRFAAAVARQKAVNNASTSVPAQAALATYLEKGGYDKHLRQLRKRLSEQRASILDALERHFPAGTRTTRPAGGFLLWVELPVPLDPFALHREALAAGVSVAPGALFGPGLNHCLRLNYGHPWDGRAEAGLARLGAILQRACPPSRVRVVAG